MSSSAIKLLIGDGRSPASGSSKVISYMILSGLAQSAVAHSLEQAQASRLSGISRGAQTISCINSCILQCCCCKSFKVWSWLLVTTWKSSSSSWRDNPGSLALISGNGASSSNNPWNSGSSSIMVLVHSYSSFDWFRKWNSLPCFSCRPIQFTFSITRSGIVISVKDHCLRMCPIVRQ